MSLRRPQWLFLGCRNNELFRSHLQNVTLLPLGGYSVLFHPELSGGRSSDTMAPRLDKRDQMRKYRFGITYWLAALLVVVITGCGQEVVTVLHP